MRLPPETWADIRRAWETTTTPVADIAHGHGTSPSTVYLRARKEMWPARPRIAVNPVQPPAPLALVLRPLAPVSFAEEASEERTSMAHAGEAAMAEPAAGAGEPAVPRAPDTPQQRALRMLRLIDLQLDSLERTMSTSGPQSAQDQERTARALTALGNQAAAVSETLEGKENSSDGARAAEEDARAEANRIRREIVERLEKLHAQRLAERGSGDP
jgi:hypothetical protein